MNNSTLFIDFDSTFSSVEAFDELVKFSIKDDAQRIVTLEEIKELNNLSMSGNIEIHEALNRQVQIINATKKDIADLAQDLIKRISPSIVKHKQFLIDNKENIHIISNGFEDFIRPVIEWFGLKTDQIYGNRFIYDRNEKIIGLDTTTPLSRPAGKPIIIKALNLKTHIIMVGDGYNDYQVKKANACDLFILYTENIRRERVVPLADVIAKDFGEVLQLVNDFELKHS